MTIREKYSNYITLFISITMTLNSIITILPIINKIFSINIHAEIPSDVYINISMKYNSRLGVIISLLGYFMIIIAKGIYQRKRTF